MSKIVYWVSVLVLYKGEPMIKVSPIPKKVRRKSFDGVGTKIMQFVEDIVFVQEKNKKEMRLSVEKRNEIAKLFYEKLGWRKDDYLQKTHKYPKFSC